MCKMFSGILTKQGVNLAPFENQSHSNLLEKMGIEDTRFNAMKKFVRLELIPPNGAITSDIGSYIFKVDQDIVPDWYENDKSKYEQEMRDAVKEFLDSNYENICGYYWVSVKRNNKTYYVMLGNMTIMNFGNSNNYTESDVRKYLGDNELLKKLKDKFSNKLLPIELDLTSMNGFKDYGSISEDYLSIMNIDILRDLGEKFPLTEKPYWLATPNQTPKRQDGSCVHVVNSFGLVDYCVCGWSELGVRPFFITES